MLTSIANDGRRDGFALPLLCQIVANVSVPVIASGGGGSSQHCADALRMGAAAVLLAGALHDQTLNIPTLKYELRQQGWDLR